MKKFLRIIFIVPIYIILVVLSNFRKLFNNAINNENILNNISFINLSIVILLLMVIFYIIFREKLKFCKKIYLPTIMISFFIILLDGIFVDKYIANYIILFIIGFLPKTHQGRDHGQNILSDGEKFIRKRYVICKIIREAAFFYHRSLYHTPNPGRWRRGKRISLYYGKRGRRVRKAGAHYWAACI